MKLLSIAILRYNSDVTEPILLSQACELSSFGFFQRGTVKEMLTFFNKTIAKRTPSGKRQSVQNEEYFVHAYMRTDGLCGCVTTDAEYPARVAYTILTKLLEDFILFKPTWRGETSTIPIVWPQLEQDVVRYQDPTNADQIMKIQKNLDDTREILHSTIDNVLARGEKLEDLVERSGELSSQSKLFYKEAKKANSCCAVV